MGIALENFDAVGKWRTEIVRKQGNKSDSLPINAKEQLPGGHVVDGFDGLKQHILTECKDAFARSLITRLLGFSLGRSLELSDQEAVENIRKQFADDQYRLRGQILKIVTSEPSLPSNRHKP